MRRLLLKRPYKNINISNHFKANPNFTANRVTRESASVLSPYRKTKKSYVLLSCVIIRSPGTFSGSVSVCKIKLQSVLIRPNTTLLIGGGGFRKIIYSMELDGDCVVRIHLRRNPPSLPDMAFSVLTSSCVGFYQSPPSSLPSSPSCPLGWRHRGFSQRVRRGLWVSYSLVRTRRVWLLCL